MKGAATMKKKYQSPDMKNDGLFCTSNLLLASVGGVQTNGTPGDGYNAGDESYSRSSFWDDEEGKGG